MKKLLLLLLGLSSVSTVYCQCLSTVGCGYFSSLGLKSNGTLWGWGAGVSGQLGDGAETDYVSPMPLGTASHWQKLICGDYTTFLLKTDGTLWGAGQSNVGQLGTGAIEYRISFTQITAANNWRQVASGGPFTLAVKTDGTLWSWGQNDAYQLGDGTAGADRLVPMQAGTDTNWLMVAGAAYGTGLGIKTNGTLWGWGLNSGLVGPSNVGSRRYPTQLSPDTDWMSICTGAGHALALKANGTLWSWGTGGQGQTGDNLSPAYFRDTPRQIGSDTWVKVAAGYNSSYGIKPDGSLWAWGWNEEGQLGDGTTTDRRLPVQIGTDTDWVDVAGGYGHAMALKANGSVWTWGRNDFGQVGNGTQTPTTTRTYIPIPGCTLDVATVEAKPLSLYPNPASTEVNVFYRGSEVADTLVIYDMTGRAVYRSHPMAGTQWQASLPVGDLQSGMYLVSLQAKGKVVGSQRFVKQ